MPAGHDFDALLIGALYGELSAVEESRLQAHLAAHPADQQIMRELTRTREAIRESAALAIVEPPQAISALILQEAARRAPKFAVEPATAESGSRWMRFLSSFLAHPALAAAAMVVVVVGVFGTMYLRNKHQVSESLLSSKAMDPAPPAAAPTTAPYLMRQQQALEGAQAAGQGSGLDPSVATATPTEPAAPPPEDLNAAPMRAGDSQVVAKVPEPSEARSDAKLDVADSFDVGLVDGAEHQRRAPPKPSKGGKKNPGYITVQPVDDLTVKDFDDAITNAAKDNKDAKVVRAPEPELAAQAARERRVAQDEEIEAAEAEAEASKGSGPSKKAKSAPEPDGLAKREESRPAVGAKPAAKTPAPKSPIVAAPPPPASTPSAPAATADMAADRVRSSDKPIGGVTATAPSSEVVTVTGSASDDKWAKSEHVRLVRLARANKCAEVASGVRTLSERASRYYQDQVANDRELRVCQAAIRDQLNLQSEQAKRKRTRSESEAPRPAPPAEKKK